MCGQTHPDNPSIVCTKPIPVCYGYHLSQPSMTSWPAPPPPAPKAKHSRQTARSRVREAVLNTAPLERVGPPLSGAQLRDAGMQRVLAATPEEYKESFYLQVGRLAASGQEFTAEDVTAVVGMPVDEAGQPKPNSIGALMNGATRTYGCVSVGQRQATRADRHANKNTVWKKEA